MIPMQAPQRTRVNWWIRLDGFFAGEFREVSPGVPRECVALLATGQLQSDESARTGIESEPAASIGLLASGNLGKLLVRLPPNTRQPPMTQVHVGERT